MPKTRIIVIIPSRYASTRLPGKPLADLAGQPMIVRVMQRAQQADGVDQVLVACDDVRIQEAVTAGGGQAVLTDGAHQSGTDRIAQAAASMTLNDDDIIVNIQGDEPLIPADLVTMVADLLKNNPEADLSTVVVPLDDAEAVANPNVVKAVVAANGRALYFSRAAVPFDRDGTAAAPRYRHIGIYGYRYRALKQMTAAAPSGLEQMEMLEQLRALEMGMIIQVGIYHGDIPHGVDTPQDLAAVRAHLGA